MRFGRLRIEWVRPTPPPVYDVSLGRTPVDPEVQWLISLPAGEARRIREDAGWSQAEVANHIGLASKEQVGKYERYGRGWSRLSGLRYARLLQELSVMRDDGPAVVTERTRV